ncbi:MAG: NmrA family protein [Marmoricola sp.]|jgi:NAD(P)H dehydrogenase (quinone)|nr:NmrA family protein [Marmoricola sp.]
MSIVVTAATGQLGRLVVERLLARGVPAGDVLATARRPEALADLEAQGVRVAGLDYDDVDDEVLSSGDVLLLVSSSTPGIRVPQHENVIRAAARAGVARIVYTSAPAADDTDLVLAPEHAATERLLEESGLPYTFLRNGWYTENYQPAFEQARATGTVVASVGDGRVASAPRADFADAAAVVLSETGHENAVYELSGDHAWDFDELAAAFTDALGKPVSYERVSPERHLEILKDAGLDDGTAGFVVALDQNLAAGLLAVTTGDLARLIGRPTVPLAETVATW